MPALAAELLMFESPVCEWCEAWNEDVGVIYAKTEEGRRFPLRRLDIHGALPQEVELVKKVRYTPTFVLVLKGKEVGRIDGYPGEANFWGLLKQITDRVGQSSAK